MLKPKNIIFFCQEIKIDSHKYVDYVICKIIIFESKSVRHVRARESWAILIFMRGEWERECR